MTSTTGPARGGGQTLAARLLGAVADCRPGEVRLVGLLFLHSFLLGVAWIYYETVSDTLFLAHFGSQALPRVYVLSTACSVLCAGVYTRLEGKVRLGAFFGGLLGLFLVTIAVTRIGLFLPHVRPVVLVMRVAYEVMYLLGELEFWSLAGTCLHLGQSKRLYPLISTSAHYPWLR